MSTTTIQDTERDETRTNETSTESRASTGSETSSATESGTASETSAGSGTDSESTPDQSTESRRPLSRDVVFGLLSTERRRRVLRYLDENDGESTLSDVAEHVAAAENGVDVAHLSSDQRKRVYVGLYQCHLPKLDDVGVVDYDQQRGTIELQERAEQLFPHLYLDAEEYAVRRSPRDVLRSTRLYDLTTTLADRLGL